MSAELIAIIGAVATVLAGFGGAALGAHFGYKTGMKLVQETHKNALDLAQRQDVNKAAAKFRNTFIVQMNVLGHDVNSGKGDTSNIGGYLGAHYVRSHLKAFEIFKCYLSPTEIEAIDKAWSKYCDFAQYSDKNNQEAMRKLALKNLEAVLKFAKHK